MSNQTKFLLVIGIIIYFVLLVFFIKEFQIADGLGPRIYIPWGFITIFISFYLFRKFNRVKKAKQDKRRQELNDRRQELLDNILKKNKKTGS